jgi:diguanylate cyclase (GGDEF)-like protein
MAVTTRMNVPHPQVRDALLRQWQSMLDVLAEFMEVPVALITRLNRETLSIYVKNTAATNPFSVGDTENCDESDAYCVDVIRHKKRLFVHNALEEPRWQNNPDLAFNLVNYLGFPLRWPNGDIFGTLCILDTEPHHYSEKQERLMMQMRDMVETNLELLETNLQLENLSQNLQYLANTDELTRVWNRRAFLSESNKELQRAQRSHHPVCLLMMDLDDFKDINDAYGHEVGDEVLQLFTHSIRASKRAYDIFGRIGGEEFAMLLPETRRPEALELAERIRQKVSEIFFHKQQTDISITVSIGVYQLAKNDTTILSVLSKADKALYAAKRAGKNQVNDMQSEG